MHSKRPKQSTAATATAVVRRRRPKVRPSGLDTETVGGEYYSKAIGRALTVLECFPDADTALSLSEIAIMSGFPESSLFRVLATLQSRSYLLRNADGSYRLAPKMVYGLVHERAEATRQQQTVTENLRGVRVGQLMNPTPPTATPEMPVQEFVF
ncbi:MAG: helix-turn-helix domain-containing protein, partial [Luteitalea sp.]|nr:helix-turn-helix domain-containing protein [Luteitalea sp.]